jgi:hypothetical protein
MRCSPSFRPSLRCSDRVWGAAAAGARDSTASIRVRCPQSCVSVRRVSLSLPSVDLVRQLTALWIFVYLAWSMHTVYGGSWFGIGVRGFALFVVYFVLFTFVTIGLLVVAVLLR